MENVKLYKSKENNIISSCYRTITQLQKWSIHGQSYFIYILTHYPRLDYFYHIIHKCFSMCLWKINNLFLKKPQYYHMYKMISNSYISNIQSVFTFPSLFLFLQIGIQIKPNSFKWCFFNLLYRFGLHLFYPCNSFVEETRSFVL